MADVKEIKQIFNVKYLTFLTSKDDFLKISKYIWDPARGGVLEGTPPRHGCCVQAPGRYCVSKHQTGTVTKQTTGARWGGLWDPAPGGVLEGGSGGGLPLPGTAAVSKHQTGTLTRLLCDDWGDHPSAKKSRFFVPW